MRLKGFVIEEVSGGDPLYQLLGMYPGTCTFNWDHNQTRVRE